MLMKDHNSKSSVMKKNYLLIFCLVLISCTAKLRYVGQESPPTKQVDVYINENAITKKYTLVGQGYLNYWAQHTRKDKIQRIAENTARRKGADAIIISDYLIPVTGQTISSTYITDSIGKAAITTGNTTISPAFFSGIKIFFIKYTE